MPVLRFRPRLLSVPMLLAATLIAAGCGDDTGPAAPDPPRFALAFGSSGSAAGQFREPRGVAVDAAGAVYVADSHNHRIQKFDADGGFLTAWGAQGSGDGRFENPWAVAVGPDGHVFVTDRNNHRVQEFTAEGTFVAAWGTWGVADGTFSHPRGLAVDGQGNVYVQEGLIVTDNNRIQKYDAAHRFVRAIGSYGQAPGRFDFTSPDGEAPLDLRPAGTRPLGDGPRGGLRGVAVDRDGNLFVADLNNHRVQTFDPAGGFVRAFGLPEAGAAGLHHPQSIAVGGDGRVYVSDASPSREIRIYDRTGTPLGAFGGAGAAGGRFGVQIGGIAVGDGVVYVADTSNDRIQKFSWSLTGKGGAVTAPR